MPWKGLVAAGAQAQVDPYSYSVVNVHCILAATAMLYIMKCGGNSRGILSETTFTRQITAIVVFDPKSGIICYRVRSTRRSRCIGIEWATNLTMHGNGGSTMQRMRVAARCVRRIGERSVKHIKNRRRGGGVIPDEKSAFVPLYFISTIMRAACFLHLFFFVF
jgi:hypothetical protein